jgi:branched-chain amino acid transport system permease protein
MNRKVKLAAPLILIALMLLLFLIPLFVKATYVLHILILVAVNVILASSLRLIATSGQLSLGHGGMMVIGAYTSALLVMKLGFSTWAALPAAGLASGGIAVLVGYPFTRLRRIYFTMVTIFFAEVIRLIIEQWRGLTGGTSGLLNIPRPNAIFAFGFVDIDFTSRAHFYYLILVMVLITLLVLYALEHSRIGLTWFSIQQADSLAESVGINTTRFKVIAFGIGCFFAGIAGAFYSHYMAVLTPTAFGVFYAINILVYMVVGGMGRFSGPIAGALVLTILPESVRILKEYQPFVFAGVMMVIVLFLPEGLVGLPERLRKLVKERLR